MIVIRRGTARTRVRRAGDAEELFRALVFSGAATGTGSRGSWRPPTEVYESEQGLEVIVEIAGMEREQIEVLIEGDVMSISGVRPDAAQCDRRSYHEARINYGPFVTEVHIPFAVDGSAASATYENGFLRVVIPKEERARTVIPVSAEID